MAEEKDAMVKLAEKFEGCDLVLNPQTAGMYVDERNKINLNFFSEGNDRVKFDKEMDPTSILKGIKAGLLRVEKDGKDISENFGGKKLEDWSRTPIVEGVPKKIDKSDEPLMNILGRNKEAEIIRDINSINNYGVLARLKELESMGKNPVSVARSAILDAINKRIKQVPGVSDAAELPQDEKDVVSAR